MRRRCTPAATAQLELLFDLTFVLAVAAVVTQLGQGVAEGRAAEVVGPFLQVFFAIRWAWMNVTWLPRPTTQMTCRTGSHLAATGKPSQDGERRCVCDAGPTAPIP